jgi:hypothetical protein
MLAESIPCVVIRGVGVNPVPLVVRVASTMPGRRIKGVSHWAIAPAADQSQQRINLSSGSISAADQILRRIRVKLR